MSSSENVYIYRQNWLLTNLEFWHAIDRYSRVINGYKMLTSIIER